jgi:hypothetical protein
MKTIKVFIAVYIHEESVHRPGNYRVKNRTNGNNNESEIAVEH